jgi:hypothetical protein
MDDDVAKDMLAGQGRSIREDDPLLDRARSLVEEDFGGEPEVQPRPAQHREHKSSSDGIVWGTGHGSGLQEKS